MRAALARDVAERIAHRVGAGAAAGGDVAERDDADEPLVAVHHRQAAHLQVAHVAGNVLQVLVVEAVLDLGAHDIGEARIGALARAHGADRDVAVGDHPDQAVAFAHRQHAGVHVGHQPRRLLDRLVRPDDTHLSGHAIPHFHLQPPSMDLGWGAERDAAPRCQVGNPLAGHSSGPGRPRGYVFTTPPGALATFCLVPFGAQPGKLCSWRTAKHEGSRT
jgi:hypothetical protein